MPACVSIFSVCMLWCVYVFEIKSSVAENSCDDSPFTKDRLIEKTKLGMAVALFPKRSLRFLSLVFIRILNWVF